MKTIYENFWSRVDMTGTAYPTPERAVPERWGPCWLWTVGADRHRPGGHGYGIFGLDGEQVGAHRVAYDWLIGPIPDGHDLDHLCRVPPCCNPEHTEPVTHQENILRGDSPSAQHARKTHCPQGHPFDEANTYRDPDGSRNCRACKRARRRGDGGGLTGGFVRGAQQRAKTHCPNGHAYDAENTIVYRGGRYCRACHRERTGAPHCR
jgi:hypothetical protein